MEAGAFLRYNCRMYRRKLYFVVALIVLMVVGFLATSVTSCLCRPRSINAQISEETLPLTSDNIYSESSATCRGRCRSVTDGE